MKKTLILFFAAFGLSLSADTLTLKNGQVYENVRVELTKTTSIVKFENGSVKSILNKFVKSLKCKIVHWKQEDGRKDLYEQERMRIAKLLIENTNWQPKEGEKPRLMILKFKKGNAISSESAEEMSNQIRTKIIATGIFSVTDRLSIEKELEKENCKTLNCSRDIGSKLKVNKLLTGEISLHGTNYHIVAEVVDIEKNKVDFSETFVVPAGKDKEEIIKNFAARIAGDTLEKWEFPIYNPQGGIPIIPYIWRSIVLPGWGQYEKENYKRFYIYPALLIVGGFFYQSNQKTYATNRDEYDLWNYAIFINQSSSLNSYLYYFSEQAKQDVNHSITTQNRIAAFLIGVYVVNLLDTIFTPVPMQLKSISMQLEKENSREMQMSGNLYKISYTHRF